MFGRRLPTLTNVGLTIHDVSEVQVGASTTLTGAAATLDGIEISGAGHTHLTGSDGSQSLNILSTGSNTITGGKGGDLILLGEGTGTDTLIVNGGEIIPHAAAQLTQDFSDADLDQGGSITLIIDEDFGGEPISFSTKTDLLMKLNALDGVASAVFGTDADANKLTIISSATGGDAKLEIAAVDGLRETDTPAQAAVLEQDFGQADLSQGGYIELNIDGNTASEVVTFSDKDDLLMKLNALEGVASAVFGTEANANTLTVTSSTHGESAKLEITAIDGLTETDTPAQGAELEQSFATADLNQGGSITLSVDDGAAQSISFTNKTDLLEQLNSLDGVESAKFDNSPGSNKLVIVSSPTGESATLKLTAIEGLRQTDTPAQPAVVVQDFEEANLSKGGVITLSIDGESNVEFTFTDKANLLTQLNSQEGIASAAFGFYPDSNKLTITGSSTGEAATLEITEVHSLKAADTPAGKVVLIQPLGDADLSLGGSITLNVNGTDLPPVSFTDRNDLSSALFALPGVSSVSVSGLANTLTITGSGSGEQATLKITEATLLMAHDVPAIFVLADEVTGTAPVPGGDITVDPASEATGTEVVRGEDVTVAPADEATGTEIEPGAAVNITPVDMTTGTDIIPGEAVVVAPADTATGEDLLLPSDSSPIDDDDDTPAVDYILNFETARDKLQLPEADLLDGGQSVTPGDGDTTILEFLNTNLVSHTDGDLSVASITDGLIVLNDEVDAPVEDLVSALLRAADHLEFTAAFHYLGEDGPDDDLLVVIQTDGIAGMQATDIVIGLVGVQATGLDFIEAIPA